MSSPSTAKILWANRVLVCRTAIVELRSRHAGSLLGIAWSIVAPLLLMALYAAVYLLIFRIRVPDLTSIEYVLFVFSGLMPFFMTAESISVGVGMIVKSRDVLTNTVYPIELAPFQAVLTGQAAMVAGMPIILLGAILVGRGSSTMLLLPVLWALHMAAVTGIVWILSLLNIVVRDIQSMIQVILMALLIASPFAYTEDMVPVSLKFLIVVNPLAYYVMAYQDILVLGRIPSPGVIAFVVLFSSTMFLIGGWFFRRMKNTMIDYA